MLPLLRIALCVVLVVFAVPSLALQPEERLASPQAEERARNLSEQLRCLVCQNQSIDESDAPFAKDLRVAIRSQITQGKSDSEIIAFLRERYGDYILLNPPFSERTALLWITPFALLAGASLGVIIIRIRRGKK